MNLHLDGLRVFQFDGTGRKAPRRRQLDKRRRRGPLRSSPRAARCLNVFLHRRIVQPEELSGLVDAVLPHHAHGQGPPRVGDGRRTCASCTSAQSAVALAPSRGDLLCLASKYQSVPPNTVWKQTDTTNIPQFKPCTLTYTSQMETHKSV